MQLIQGDCLELLTTLPTGSVDLIAADLPYSTTRNAWDQIIPLESLWREYKRVAKANAAIVLTASQPFASTLIMSQPKLFRYDLIWEKVISTGFLNATRMPLRAHESILVFYRQLPTYNPQKTMSTPYHVKQGSKQSTNYGDMNPRHVSQSDGERHPRSVLKFPHDKRGLHPTAKPVALMEWIIRTYSQPGDTVLDNVCGSGTTGVACINTGREFIGMERDPGYFAIAKARLEKISTENVVVS